MATNEGVADNAFLKEEYFFLQKTYEDFDSKSISIKTWSVSGSLVLIGAGFSEKGSAELFCIGAIASLFFLGYRSLLERLSICVFKAYQDYRGIFYKYRKEYLATSTNIH